MITDSKTFCPHPWITMNMDQTGKVFPCMNSGYELGNIKKSSIQDIIAGEPRKELCNTISRGEWHSACAICKQNEESSGVSARTQAAISQEFKDQLNADPLWYTPVHLTINWSNLCNLTCVYCNPQTSTAWQSVKKIPIDFVRNEHASLIELMKEKGHHVEGLTIGGGEPLLQKGMVDMLKLLDPKSVKVNMLTNLSIDITKNEIYQLLKTWPNVEWQISFDNANKEKFEYVRHGAEWEQFVANIVTMKQDNQNVTAHPAYSIYCAFDLDEYYAFCKEHGLNIFWCDLWHPWDLDARRLPKDLRDDAIAHIEKAIQHWDSGSADILRRYQQQLADPTYLPNYDTYKMSTIRYHEQIESELGKKTKFVDLWPKLAEKLQ